MSLEQDKQIEATLCDLFPTEFLQEQARKTGAVQRDRKVDLVALFWTLVLGFGIGKDRKIADLRRSYIAATGQRLCPSAFYDRFTRAFVEFLRQAVVFAIESVWPNAPGLSGVLSAFRDLVLVDATIIRLHALLQKAYAACRTNHTKAACKLHLIYSVLGTSEQKVTLTPERTRESHTLAIGEWVKGRLLLFDLGYFKYALFDRIDRFGGYFISRLKGLCNPTIVALNVACPGRARALVGEKLKDVLKGLKRKYLDVQVEVRFARRIYRGKRTWVKRQFRVVGIYDEQAQDYHLYLTNISPQQLTAAQVAKTYAGRWIVELVFKQLKSYFQLDSLPSGKQEIVEALIYTALLTMAVSRTIQNLLEMDAQQAQTPAYVGAERHFPLLRIAAVLRDWAHDLLEAVLREAGLHKKNLSLWEMIRQEAVDPNRSRKHLLQRIQAI